MNFERLYRFLLTNRWWIVAGSLAILLLVFRAKNVLGCFVIAFYFEAGLRSLVKLRLQQKELKARGLTRADLRNIDFVRDWEINRKIGLTRYCLRNGGFIFGVALFVPIAFLTFWLLGLTTVLSGFQNLFIIMAIVSVASYVLGVLTYFFRWKFNERLFAKLTDPFRALQPRS